MDLIAKGIVTGFVLSIMIGPVFFVLLETSIRKGIRAAIAFDLGVILNDIVYIAIAFFFYNQVESLSSGQDNSLLRLIGGVLFIAYGIYNFFKHVKEFDLEDDNDDVKNSRGYLLLALKGFLLNLANPLVVFYWFSVMTLGAKDAAEGGSVHSMFISVSYTHLTLPTNREV